MSHSHLLAVAKEAALKAGELLKKGFGTTFKISSKDNIQNLVTEYDKASEKLIIDLIMQQFPSHSFLSEEFGPSDNQSGEVLWVIDPLDGTVNFAHSVPVFSISIAATIQNEVVCGVVYQPITNELFYAEKNKGAFLNGVRLKVSKTARMEESFMATGFPYNINEDPLQCIEHFVAFARKGIAIRRLGSAALDCAYVASGRFDAFWEVILFPWDVAAGKLLIEEAGGKISQYSGAKRELLTTQTVLATNSLLHEQMVSILSNEYKLEFN